MKKSETRVIIAAMRELGNTIECDDGVANDACHEAADRLEEMLELLQKIDAGEEYFFKLKKFLAIGIGK